jgi:hypothetical protein
MGGLKKIKPTGDIRRKKSITSVEAFVMFVTGKYIFLKSMFFIVGILCCSLSSV